MPEDERRARQKEVVNNVLSLLALDSGRKREAVEAVNTAIRGLSRGTADWDRFLRNARIKKPLADFCISIKKLKKALHEIENFDNLLLIQLDRHFRKVDFKVLFALGDMIAPVAFEKTGPQARYDLRKHNAAHEALRLLRRFGKPVNRLGMGTLDRRANGTPFGARR